MNAVQEAPLRAAGPIRRAVIAKRPRSADDYCLIAASPEVEPGLAATLKRRTLRGWTTESSGDVATNTLCVFKHDHLLVAAHHHVSEHRDAQGRPILVSSFAWISSAEAEPDLTPAALLALVRPRVDVASVPEVLPEPIVPRGTGAAAVSDLEGGDARAVQMLRSALVARRLCVLLRAPSADPSAVYAAAVESLPPSQRWCFSYLEASTIIDPSAPFDVVAGRTSGVGAREIIDGSAPAIGPARSGASDCVVQTARHPSFDAAPPPPRPETPLLTPGAPAAPLSELEANPLEATSVARPTPIEDSVPPGSRPTFGAGVHAAMRVLLTAIQDCDPSLRGAIASWCAAPSTPLGFEGAGALAPVVEVPRFRFPPLPEPDAAPASPAANDRAATPSSGRARNEDLAELAGIVPRPFSRSRVAVVAGCLACLVAGYAAGSWHEEPRDPRSSSAEERVIPIAARPASTPESAPGGALSAAPAPAATGTIQTASTLVSTGSATSTSGPAAPPAVVVSAWKGKGPGKKGSPSPAAGTVSATAAPAPAPTPRPATGSPPSNAPAESTTMSTR